MCVGRDSKDLEVNVGLAGASPKLGCDDGGCFNLKLRFYFMKI
jgi:hypothetical protein